MKFGVFMFPTDYAIAPAQLAQAMEERGFESLFFPEHTHIPSSRATPFPGGGDLPKEYSHTLDPFVALAAAATATKSLLIGTGICLVIERDPIVLAKEVASLDHISGGRALFGIGAGWNREEMGNHGTGYKQRWKILRERIEAMKEIWTKDEATYHGEHVNFDSIWSWPKPIQKPHPPIIVGGDGAGTLPRVVRYGDEWMPVSRGRSAFGERTQQLQELAHEAGRGPIPVGIFGASSKPEALEQYRKDGISRCVFHLPPASADVVLPRLDELADVAKSFG